MSLYFIDKFINKLYLFIFYRKHLLLDIINPQKRNVFNFNPTVDEANDKERLIQKLPVIDFRI